MKYFNICYLLILLSSDIVKAHLFKIWSGDRGWYLFVLSIYISISVVFWIIVSSLSFVKKAKLKNGFIYFIIIAGVGIILSIDYYKLQFLERIPHNYLLHWLPYVLTILICLLPFANISKFHQSI